MEEMVREAGAEILYDVQVCDVLTDGGKITGVVAAMKEGMAVFAQRPISTVPEMQTWFTLQAVIS